ncbi:allatostatin-A receptor-like [Saccoglossus kowalevskii]|uniref:Allatostatin-A receptor-like n=1 Tax=Saccoglossus kowalevskii TaxID=10224 RepID=A0ABM0MIH4_SACKO|nr:PREDICTED: allatostatin-A receptor-like [Saccoglossus kowalevskii]
MEIENSTNVSNTVISNDRTVFRYTEYLQLIVGVIGVIGNACVFVLVCKIKLLHTIPNMFIANLAMADMIASFCILAKLVDISFAVPKNINMSLYCKLVRSDFFFWMSADASILTLIGVTIERYCAIVYPFRYHASFTNMKAYMLIASVWILAVFLAIPLANSYDSMDNYCVIVYDSKTKKLFIMIFFVTYLLPLISMILAYTNMFKRIGLSTSDRPADAATISSRRRLLKMLSIVVTVFFVCWSPNQWLYFLSNLGVQADYTATYYQITVLMCLSNSSINPIIYALKSKQFKHAFLSLIHRGNVIDHEGSVVATTHELI